jgi:uncharacterized protein YndB with AHSA1/START domain
MSRTTGTPKGRRVVGQTKDVGFQIGVQRTLPIPLEQAWALLTSPQGMRLWLGGAPRMRLEKGATYTLPDGSTGALRVFEPDHHLRITWQPRGWARPSTIQVRVIPSGDKTTLAFHQEHLPDSAAREQRRAHFESALGAIERMIEET